MIQVSSGQKNLKIKKPALIAWYRINGKLKSFSIQQLPNWQTPWALTAHKSQGSKYDNVLLVSPSEESQVVTRELIYTGVTRAAKKCTVVANWQQLNNAVRRNVVRFSGLGERVGWTD